MNRRHPWAPQNWVSEHKLQMVFQRAPKTGSSPSPLARMINGLFSSLFPTEFVFSDIFLLCCFCVPILPGPDLGIMWETLGQDAPRPGIGWVFSVLRTLFHIGCSKRAQAVSLLGFFGHLSLPETQSVIQLFQGVNVFPSYLVLLIFLGIQWMNISAGTAGSAKQLCTPTNSCSHLPDPEWDNSPRPTSQSTHHGQIAMANLLRDNSPQPRRVRSLQHIPKRNLLTSALKISQQNI